MLQQLIERNSWEGETFRYYFDTELFKEEIKLFPEVTKLDKSYELGEVITEEEFEKLPDTSGYMAYHNLVYSFVEPFTKFNKKDDPFYKGRGLRFGGWEELKAAKWWKAHKEGTIPLFWTDSRPSWSKPVIKDDFKLNQQVVLGHKNLSFLYGDYHKGVEVGMEFLDWKRKKIIVVDWVKELTGKEQLEYFADYPFYNSYTNGTKEPCDRVTTFTYQIKDLVNFVIVPIDSIELTISTKKEEG